jgi:hypothetical protein
MICQIKINNLTMYISFVFILIFNITTIFSSLLAQEKQEISNASEPTIYVYQTISPDLVLKQKDRIAKEVFHIRNPQEAEFFFITNQGFLYFERNYKYSKNYRKHKQKIASKKEAEMILKKHADNFNKKMQATLSGDPMNPVAVTYFNWEHFKLERLNPKIGSIVGSWEAFLYLELPSIQKVGSQTREKSGVTGENIRVEFTKQEIIQLDYDHLPVVGYDSTRLIQTDKNGKKMINSVSYERITPTELLPYYSLGGRKIPAIDNQDEIVLYTDTIYDKPDPKIFGNQESLLQILGGHGSDYKQNLPGLVNMQMNLYFKILVGKNLGRFHTEMIQADQIQSLLERTIQHDLKGLVLTSCPMPGKELYYRILKQQEKLHASEYYCLSLTPSVKTCSNPVSNFLEAFASTGFPSKNCIILSLNPDWGDTASISAQLAQYYHHRKLILDSKYWNKEKPIAEISLRKAIDDIRSFCHYRAVSLCLLHLIEERVETYKNTHLVIGNYFYGESESDVWFSEKLNEYGIFLFPDMVSALHKGTSGKAILDIQDEIDTRELFNISDVVSKVMKASLFTQADFDYRQEGKIIKPYHICQLFSTAPVVILNPALGTENLNEFTCGILQAFSGIDSFRHHDVISNITVENCLLNFLFGY